MRTSLEVLAQIWPRSGRPTRRWEAAALTFGLWCLAGGCTPHSQSVPNGSVTTVNR